MITLDGNHFIYNDVPSSKYKLIFARVETSPARNLSGTKKGRFIFNQAMKQRYLVDDDYTDTPMSFDVEIVTCDGEPMELRTLREVERWLFTNSTFRKLYVDPADDPYGETYEIIYGKQKKLYFNCRFMNPEKLEYNGGVVGFKCTIETDGMMLWQDSVTASFDLSDPVMVEIEGEQVRVLKGDLDFNGLVDLYDIIKVNDAYNKVIMGLDSGLTELEMLAADYDEDGELTLRDVLIITQIYNYADLLYLPVQHEYVYYDVVKKTEIDMEEAFEVTIPVDSDIDGYTYPKITVTMGLTGVDEGDDVLTIINDTDTPRLKDGEPANTRRVTEFSGLDPYDTFVIDSETHMVSNGNYSKMTRKNFPRLVEGDNKIIIKGNVLNISITWQNRRFL